MEHYNHMGRILPTQLERMVRRGRADVGGKPLLECSFARQNGIELRILQLREPRPLA